MRVGDNPASLLYVSKKLEKAETIGINAREVHLPDNTTQDNLKQLIEELNNDPKTNGILIQLPLPKQLISNQITSCVNHLKDVDGLSPYNVGALATNLDGLIPCTPLACTILLHSRIKDLSGMHAVIIGKSNLVGRPLGQLLMHEECTVTNVHKLTKNISDITKQADIIIAAAGSPGLVKADWVKDGAYVIDVGITNVNGKIKGDVDFDSVVDKVTAITPVPGGVGPMTVACLMLNTVKATCLQHNIEPQFITVEMLRDLH